MNSGNLYPKLAKYFAGESSTEEISEIKKWLSEDEKNKVLFEEAKSVWESTKLPSNLFNAEDAWEKVKTRKDNSEFIPTSKNDNNYKTIFSNPALLKIAASIILIIALSVVAYNQFIPVENQTTYISKSISTDKNEIKKVRLDDGSFVTLNSESEISIPKSFNNNERIVGLSGEAYFEVAHNTSKPFLVKTKNALIKVVGTKFNITAWTETPDVTVAVSEGKVQFSSSDENKNEPVIVTKGEMSSVKENSLPIKPLKIDVEKYYLFWLNDELNFYNASFKTVIQRLEMKYNVDISVDDISILSKHLTANFKEESLSEILNTISIALNLGYSVNKNKIVFNTLIENKRN